MDTTSSATSADASSVTSLLSGAWDLASTVVTNVPLSVSDVRDLFGQVDPSASYPVLVVLVGVASWFLAPVLVGKFTGGKKKGALRSALRKVVNHLELRRVLFTVLAAAGFLHSALLGGALLAVAFGLALGYCQGMREWRRHAAFVLGAASFFVSEVLLLAWGRGGSLSDLLALVSACAVPLGAALVSAPALTFGVRRLVAWHRRVQVPSAGVVTSSMVVSAYTGAGPVEDALRDPVRAFPEAMILAAIRDQGYRCFNGDVGCVAAWDAGVIDQIAAGEGGPGIKWKVGTPYRGDHRVPHSWGGRTCRENLAVLCDRCNSFKSDKPEAHAREEIMRILATGGSLPAPPERARRPRPDRPVRTPRPDRAAPVRSLADVRRERDAAELEGLFASEEERGAA